MPKRQTRLRTVLRAHSLPLLYVEQIFRQYHRAAPLRHPGKAAGRTCSLAHKKATTHLTIRHTEAQNHFQTQHPGLANETSNRELETKVGPL